MRASAYQVAKKLEAEFVVAVKGRLKLRPEKQRKDKVGRDKKVIGEEYFCHRQDTAI